MSLTAFEIRKAVQIANCCSAKRTADIIRREKKGYICDSDWADIDTIQSLVDAISIYGKIITKPSYEFTVTNAIIGGSSEIIVNGDSIATVASATNDTSTHAQEIIAALNTIYPSTGISATYDANAVILYGEFDSSQNGYTVSVQGPIGMGWNLPLPAELSGGQDYKDLVSENVLTDEEIQRVLDKLCKLCPKDCEQYVKFQN